MHVELVGRQVRLEVGAHRRREHWPSSWAALGTYGGRKDVGLPSTIGHSVTIAKVLLPVFGWDHDGLPRVCRLLPSVIDASGEETGVCKKPRASEITVQFAFGASRLAIDLAVQGPHRLWPSTTRNIAFEMVVATCHYCDETRDIVHVGNYVGCQECELSGECFFLSLSLCLSLSVCVCGSGR